MTDFESISDPPNANKLRTSLSSPCNGDAYTARKNVGDQSCFTKPEDSSVSEDLSSIPGPENCVAKGAPPDYKTSRFNSSLLMLDKPASELVTREEIQEHLWGTNKFLDFEDSLNQAVCKLREALQDSASARASSRRSRAADIVFSCRSIPCRRRRSAPRPQHTRVVSPSGGEMNFRNCTQLCSR
jgi:hypothetical protein